MFLAFVAFDLLKYASMVFIDLSIINRALGLERICMGIRAHLFRSKVRNLEEPIVGQGNYESTSIFKICSRYINWSYLGAGSPYKSYIFIYHQEITERT